MKELVNTSYSKRILSIFYFILTAMTVYGQTTIKLGGPATGGSCVGSCTTCQNGPNTSGNILLQVGERMDFSFTTANVCNPTSGSGWDTGENINFLAGVTKISRLASGNNNATLTASGCFFNANNHSINVRFNIVNNSDVLSTTDRQDEVVTITYTITSGNNACTTLPIQLSSFDAKIDGVPILLWTTVSELNNDYFTLDRSTDGRIFKQIFLIKGKGTSDKGNDYTYTDLTPNKGINYYRLSQVDFNGTTTTFPIKSVLVPVDKITVYPTIFHHEITILLPTLNNNPATWFLSDVNGREIKRGGIAHGQMVHQLALPGLNAGPYILTILSDTEKQAIKLIKL